MSEKGLWAATSRTDVLFSIVQIVLKGSLACLGWYTALTLPPLFTEAGALALPPTPLSPLVFGLAAPHMLKAMELSDMGTDHNRLHGDEIWANAASGAHACFSHPKCVAPKPAWFSDAQRLKRMADRAVAALPNEITPLQMRSTAYAGSASASADELRQALRDRRRLAEIFEEGNSGVHVYHSQMAQRIEAQLRARIAADLAAMKLAER
jgi:hypothetical protein